MFSPYKILQDMALQERKSLENAKVFLSENYNEEQISSHPELLMLAGIYLELQTISYIQAIKVNREM